MESSRPMYFPWGSNLRHSSSTNHTLSSKDLVIKPADLSFRCFINEQIKNFEEIAENIKWTKKEFLKKFQDMDKQIEQAMEQIYSMENKRRQELKRQLAKIWDSEISCWNRQQKICEEAEDWLNNLKGDFPPCFEFLEETSNMYARDIGFISSPEVVLGEFSSSNQNCFFKKIGKQLAPMIAPNSCTGKKEPKFCIGSRGKNVGEFDHPWGVCTDTAGRILVADSHNNRVQVFDERGKFLFEFGKPGTKAGEFYQPVGITVDKKSRIIVTDKNNHRVQVFTFCGKFIFMFGQRGSEPGQFQYPWDVDSNSEGEIAVSDSKNYRVKLFTETGMFVSEFGIKKYTEGIMQSPCPCGVAFKPDGFLLVTDVHNDIILKLDKTFKTATKIESYPQFCTPQGIACNSCGKLVVADSKNDRIQVFDDQEKLEGVFGVQGTKRGEFQNPVGVCFHPNGSIIVTDFGNNRVQVF